MVPIKQFFIVSSSYYWNNWRKIRNRYSRGERMHSNGCMCRLYDYSLTSSMFLNPLLSWTKEAGSTLSSDLFLNRRLPLQSGIQNSLSRLNSHNEWLILYLNASYFTSRTPSCPPECRAFLDPQSQVGTDLELLLWRREERWWGKGPSLIWQTEEF